jgi:uncharacterized protein
VHPHLNAAVMVIQWLFFEGKMRALFSMLFGAGSILLLERIEAARGAGAAADIFPRRNLWLLLFGVLHGTLIWNGDVLTFYSSLALLALYPFRHLASRTLVGIGIVIALAGVTFGTANLSGSSAGWDTSLLEEASQDAIARGALPTPPQASALRAAHAERQMQITKASSSEREGYSIGDNAAAYVAFVTAIFTSGWFFETLGLLIAGMGLLKTGFLTGKLSSKSYAAVVVVGFGIAVPVVLGGLWHAWHYDFSSAVTTFSMMLPYELQAVSASLAIAAAIILIVRHQYLLNIQRALAAIGRMAFTNYILTSVIFQSLFVFFHIVPTANLEQYQMMLLVILIWICLSVFSLIWLRAFLFGPLEWCWRSLTYWKAQPILLQRPLGSRGLRLTGGV